MPEERRTAETEFIPATDPETLKHVVEGDFLRAEGLQSGQPRIWGGTIKAIDRDEHGLYFTLREPIEMGILWENRASTVIDRITIVTDPTEQATIIKTGNFLPKKRPPVSLGRHYHGYPESRDWTGHRIGYQDGPTKLWGQCLYDDADGNLWIMFDNEPTLYTETPGEVFACEHFTPCGTTANETRR